MAKRFLWLAGLLASFAAQANGQGDKQQTRQSPADARYDQLMKEYREAVNSYYRPFYEAKSNEERSKIRLDPKKNPDREYAARFMALANEARGTAVAIKALGFVCQNVYWDAALWKQAADRLVAEHLEAAELADVIPALASGFGGDAHPYLQAALDKSPHPRVRGLACYYLAQVVRRPPRATGLWSLFSPGKSEAEREREAIALLERARDEFGDVSLGNQTLRAVAERDLFELRHLAIGKVAPEITGKDVDGNEFKLSDYRGKVVVLDFWGDW